MPIRFLSLVLALGLLAGCAGPGHREAVQGQGDVKRWASYKTELNALSSWQLQGKIGIRSPKESGSGTLLWQQQDSEYDIRLSGPLGRGALRLSGHPGAVRLDSAQGHYNAASPEELADKQLGWQLPVSNLLYWIRGVPAPGSRSRVLLNGDSHLAALEQDGWRIDYLSYTNLGQLILPQRLELHGQGIQVVLVIKNWQTPGPKP